MTKEHNNTFIKKERICKRKVIAFLLKNGKQIQCKEQIISIKYIFIPKIYDTITTQILIIVPKKNIKIATKRNKIKRIIREIYRLNKHLFQQKRNCTLLIMFTYKTNVLYSYNKIKEDILQQITYIS